MNDTADSEANDETRELHPESTGVLELAANGRAKCRACGETLVKGQPRCGERTANPFGEGTTVYWFHLRCAAERRPHILLQGLATGELPSNAIADEEQAELQTIAGFCDAHPRAARFTKVGVAPSGRARCRGCKELIEKGTLRLELSIFNDGRFDPMGYLHVTCITSYTQAKAPWQRLERMCQSLSEDHQDIIRRECA